MRWSYLSAPDEWYGSINQSLLKPNGDALRCSMARLCSDAKVASWMMLSGTPALLCTALPEGQKVLQEFDSICLGFSDLFANNVGEQELHYIRQNANIHRWPEYSLPSNWSIPSWWSCSLHDIFRQVSSGQERSAVPISRIACWINICM